MRNRRVRPEEVRSFRRVVYRRFAHAGRSFPWRPPALRVRADGTLDPYAVLISEVMLQQTQVERVVPKFREFMKKFPTVRALARARGGNVLRAWQGLGYNRRAQNLGKAAKAVTARFGSRIPEGERDLASLPGVGPYTAAAVRAFAWNRPALLLETNIRAAILHWFFPRARRVPDAALLPVIEAVQDRRNPRRWYSALMDYGADLKRSVPNPSRQSAHHARQLAFRGSRRELRGTILALAARSRSVKVSDVRKALPRPQEEVAACLADLVREGFLVRLREDVVRSGETKSRSGSRFRLK